MLLATCVLTQDAALSVPVFNRNDAPRPHEELPSSDQVVGLSLPPKQDGHPQDRYEYYLVKVVAMWARATAVSVGPYAALTGAHYRLRATIVDQRLALSLSESARARNCSAVAGIWLFNQSAIATSSRRFSSQSWATSASPSDLAAAIRIV